MIMSTVLLLLVIMRLTESVGAEYSGVYSTFPKYRRMPQEEEEALQQGYIQDKVCSSPQDQYGIIYSRAESRLLPGLMYNTHGQLSGMVFGVNRTLLYKPDEAFAPFMHDDIRGQVYWFRDPTTICDPDSTKTQSVADGIWVKLPDNSLYQLPERPDFPTVGMTTDYHWTEHLCLVGMGTHYQYGQCDSGYQFTAFYDADDKLTGVINAINLEETMEDTPDLIEKVTTHDLLGLVLNESRFDACFNLKQPRIFIHVYLNQPEVEYQSCDKDIEFTSNNNQVKRCNLCAASLKSLAGDLCSGDPMTAECCCQMDSLRMKTGGCGDQGCDLPSTCDIHDMSECESAATCIVVTYWGLMASLIALLVNMYYN